MHAEVTTVHVDEPSTGRRAAGVRRSGRGNGNVRPVLRCFTAAAALVLLAACGSAVDPPRCTPSAATTEHVVRPPAREGGTTLIEPKPVLTGLLDRAGFPDDVESLGGYVLSIPFAELQPRPGSLASPNPLDEAIARIRKEAPSLRLKLRVLMGIHSPTWAKEASGGEVAVVYQDQRGTVPCFWTSAFGDIYRQLNVSLAERYDDVPELAQVEITRCTTFYGEPLLRQWGHPETQQNLVAAGYSDEQDEFCQREALRAHLTWQRTRSGLALNPYQRINDDASIVDDPAFTERMMDECRATLEEHCVLENYSIRSPLQPEPYPAMYDAMRQRGGPTAFQTAALARVGDLEAALTWAVEEMGASSIELPRGYRRELGDRTLADIARSLSESIEHE